MLTITFINVIYCLYIMGNKKLILKVQKNKANNQKYVNIPKNEDIFEGDYVLLEKVVDNQHDI